MASVTQNFMKLFRSSPGGAEAASQQPAQKMSRRSSGLGELARVWDSETPLCVLDLGSTSPANISFFTERSHKIYSEDLLVASTDPSLITKDEEGKVVLDSRQFLADNLVYPAAHFDVVLCWNLPDYLDESLVRPVMGRLWSVLKPGGMLLAFFHTKDAGPDSPCYRFHIVGKDTLEMQRIVLKREARRGPTGAVHTAITEGFRLQRVFNNRHIETLFRDFASIKFFLARDNVREVLVVR
ncbi:MAG TPA: class I SAM-dependent methyltransferase [Candidatus Sulfotelmatobacter sp.]|jgi:SAM-dependent methyltransferase|nr:class I SAM-dependent methyltransferase [Candidatus Sulfotelmatobacter sp.]